MATNISTVKIKASKSAVWDAITEPEFIRKWQFGSELRTTWIPGDEIRFVTEWQGKTFEQWGRVVSFDPQESLSYSLFAPRPDLEDKPENYFVMRYTLADEEGLTVLTIAQEDNRPGAVQESPQTEENPILRSLKELVESTAAGSN